MSKLFGSIASKLWIAAAAAVILLVGTLTLPPPAPSAVPAPPERAAPLIEAAVERRQQMRLFEDIQQLGPRVARHSVTIPESDTPARLTSDTAPRRRPVDPAGYGLIVSADGDVLTSAGALRGREALSLVLFDGRVVSADVAAFDPDTDLVLLRAPDVPRTDAAPWATTPPTAGMLAVAVAHAATQIAVAPVFVMAAPDADRRVRTTSADLLPGTPLFTTAGEVFAMASGAGDASAVLIAPGVARLRERIADGRARRGALGLTFQALDEPLATAFRAEGVLIADVVRHGPADVAGVQPGDVIAAIGDLEVRTPDTARDAIARLAPGSPVTLRAVRRGKPLTVQVVATSALSLRPRDALPPPEVEAPDARLLLADSVRQDADLLPQTRVLTVNGTRVRSVEEARRLLLRGGPRAVLYIEDERGRAFRVVERPR